MTSNHDKELVKLARSQTEGMHSVQAEKSPLHSMQQMLQNGPRTPK